MIGLVVFAALSAGQSPEETKPAGASVSEIIVTGERVERSLRETPSSVAVFTGDEIERQRGSDRLEDLLQQVPNVQLGTGSQGPAIRGQEKWPHLGLIFPVQHHAQLGLRQCAACRQRKSQHG